MTIGYDTCHHLPPPPRVLCVHQAPLPKGLLGRTWASVPFCAFVVQSPEKKIHGIHSFNKLKLLLQKSKHHFPQELAKLQGGLQGANNTHLNMFCLLSGCAVRPTSSTPTGPQPFSADISWQMTSGSSHGHGHCNGSHCPPLMKALMLLVVVTLILLAVTANGLFMFSWHRWHKEKGHRLAGDGGRCSTEAARSRSLQKSVTKKNIALDIARVQSKILKV